MKYLLIFVGVLFLLVESDSLWALGQPNVSVTPSQTNNFGQYTITSSTGNGNTNLIANTDSIIIFFGSATTLPSSIDPTYITVNNTAANAVSIYPTSSNRIAILTPVNIAKNGGTITIVISALAEIVNPASAGNYTLQIETTTERGLITSTNYSISASSSTVSQPAVTPNPSVENLSAAYTVAFNVGSGGLLTTGVSTITIGFPTATGIPNGGLSGVTVNGTTANASANNDTVVIIAPLNVSNNEAVSVVFSLGTGLSNPTSGTYNLSVKTSSENTYVSSANYTISSSNSLSVTAVTLSPTVVNAQAQYSLDFVTSSTGSLTANTDSIVFIFQPNAFLPALIVNSNITITSGGFSDIAAGIAIQKSNSADDDTLFIKTPISIGNSSSVTLNIASTAGILNPSVLGNYYLRLMTSKDRTPVSSSAYAVTNTSTTVSQSIVTPTLTTASAKSPYRIDFNLGANGRLNPGTSTITLTFASGYTLSTTASDYDSTYISVASGAFIQIPTTNIAPNNTAKTIQFTIPSSVISHNNDNIVLIVKRRVGAQPITNPTAGNYNLGVKTSVEASNINSATYNIGGTSIALTGITLSNSTVNSNSTYTFSFTGNNLNGSGGSPDVITITFPEGTVLPATIAATNITLNGAQPASASINTSTRTVTVTVQNGNVSSPFTLVLGSTTAVISNPTVPSTSFYKVTMYTSQNLAPVTSTAYTIAGHSTSVTAVSATASPSVQNATSSIYTVTFTTSSTGKLAGGTASGSSSITIAFGSRTRIPSSITASSVKVNSNACQTVTVLTSGDSGKIKINIPDGLTIDNNTAVSVVFDTSARLDNRNPFGTSTIVVKTSSDTTNASGTYTITLTQLLAVTSVVPSPSRINAASGYSIKFTTGSSGALNQGDTIRIAFPSNTFVPSSINKNDLTVNGINPLVNPTVIGDTIKVNVPQAGGIANLTNVTILINSAAGILNPTTIGTYTLQVRTQAEQAYVVSPTYSITSGISSVTTPSVSVTNPRLATVSPYTVSFNVGANGRLIAGSSTVTITFNASTTVSATNTNYDSTYITVDGVATQIPTGSISISGQSVTMTIPTGISIDNNDAVVITINRIGATDPVTNPGIQGSYTLTVRTSVETTDVTSGAYSISNVAAVATIRTHITPDTVNAASVDTIRFTVGSTGALTANSGTITITFPSNTYIPSSINTSNVRVASQTNNTFTNAFAVSTNPLLRSVTITTPVVVSNNDSVRVAFLTGAGIENPSVYGDYTLNVHTSAQPIDGTSSAYTLKPTVSTISNVALSVTPNDTSQFGRYTWSFKTGMRGRLVSGISTITMIIPYDATFTQGTPAASKVTVNSIAAGSVSLKQGVLTNADTLVVTVPTTVTIGNLANVTVIIDSSAGLRNVSFRTVSTYSIFTSVETSITGTDVTLPVELAYFRTEQSGNEILINWRTESEIENAYWLIQKAEVMTENVSAANLDFKTIATIKGQGTKTNATDYSLSDRDAQVGKSYAYRIADISYGGVIVYHEIQYVTFVQPKKFSLYQNYPNPFNPVTKIKFDLPYLANVKIKVYNILGQEVAELINKEMPAGFHTLEWNGRNDRNDIVSSGVYLYRIVANTSDGKHKFSSTKKMMLIK
ncbi:hypothetical protein K1X84_01300 [bacterium]|nr:hypothetical protein [bacterium]